MAGQRAIEKDEDRREMQASDISFYDFHIYFILLIHVQNANEKQPNRQSGCQVRQDGNLQNGGTTLRCETQTLSIYSRT
jgi:hypothetical protein